MVSLGRTAGFYCCRSTPAIPSVGTQCIYTSASRVCRPKTHMRAVSTAAFALLKNLSGTLAAQQARSKGFDSLSVNLSISRLTCSLRSVGARAYYSESGFQYGRANAPVEQFGQAEQDGDQFPRPTLIPWEKELANAVQLIGNVGKDLDIKYLDSGKIVAKTSLAVKKAAQKNEDPSWFELEFWDELAEVAAHHVKKGDQIFVTGRISVDKTTASEGTFTRVKVSVSNLCFVESYNSPRRSYVQPNALQNDSFTDRAENRWPRDAPAGATSQQNWNSQALSQQPSAQAGSAVTGTAAKGTYEEESLLTEKRWQAFFADPSQWWDNRVNKKNPKAPDFKHKSTQEVLWLNSWNNPLGGSANHSLGGETTTNWCRAAIK